MLGFLWLRNAKRLEQFVSDFDFKVSGKDNSSCKWGRGGCSAICGPLATIFLSILNEI